MIRKNPNYKKENKFSTKEKKITQKPKPNETLITTTTHLSRQISHQAVAASRAPPRQRRHRPHHPRRRRRRRPGRLRGRHSNRRCGRAPELRAPDPQASACGDPAANSGSGRPPPPPPSHQQQQILPPPL